MTVIRVDNQRVFGLTTRHCFLLGETSAMRFQLETVSAIIAVRIQDWASLQTGLCGGNMSEPRDLSSRIAPGASLL